MRNAFGTGPHIRAEQFDHEHSRDQLSIAWNSGSATAAWPLSRDGRTWEIDVEHFASDHDLARSINQRRGGPSGDLPLSQDTYYLTTIPEFSERTRILALSGDRLALSDQELVHWLINAEQQVALGTDDHPIFETSLDDTACVIRRLPNGLVAMTEVPRSHVLSARDRLRQLLGDRVSSFVNARIETPIRSVARYFLTAVKEGELVQRAGKESEVTAFIVIRNAGFRFGLWSPSAGLFSEYGFLAPKEISRTGERTDLFKTVPMDPAPDQRSVEAYIRQAFDQLELQLSKEKLEQLQLSGYAQVVWASEHDLAAMIAPIAAEHASQIGIQAFHLEASLDEALVGGLLLGSFAFGDSSSFGASILPVADLARDLLVLADTEEDIQRFNQELFERRRRNGAILSLVSAPIMTAAALLAIVAGLLVSGLFTGIRDARANARTQELKPALDMRNSIEANLKWYQEFVKQVSRLRKQQPVGIGLLYQLNSDYPFTIDQAFFISDMTLGPKGDVEMKGFARSKDAVASFLKSLEFAGGPESGSRLFGNLTYEVQEGAPQPIIANGQSPAPTMAGGLLASNQIKPGIIVWNIKGIYLPMKEFVPPDPTKPGAAASPAPVASPTAQ